MRIAEIYSFNGGRKAVEALHRDLLGEIGAAVVSVDERRHISNSSKLGKIPGQQLYSPASLNRALKRSLARVGGWLPIHVGAQYSVNLRDDGAKSAPMNEGASRKIEFVKNKIGLDVQFCADARTVYSGCAKMTIFHNLGHIDAGVEIVPVKAFAAQMRTRVSCFEQFIWDIEARGVSNLDVPVLLIGVTAEPEEAPRPNILNEPTSVRNTRTQSLSGAGTRNYGSDSSGPKPRISFGGSALALYGRCGGSDWRHFPETPRKIRNPRVETCERRSGEGFSG